MGIPRYLNHTVSIVHITKASGSRSIGSTDSNVPAFVLHTKEVIRDQQGDHLRAAVVIYLKPDQTVGDEDEIICDGMQRPISRIELARGSRSDRVFFKKVVLS